MPPERSLRVPRYDASFSTGFATVPKHERQFLEFVSTFRHIRKSVPEKREEVAYGLPYKMFALVSQVSYVPRGIGHARVGIVLYDDVAGFCKPPRRRYAAPATLHFHQALTKKSFEQELAAYATAVLKKSGTHSPQIMGMSPG